MYTKLAEVRVVSGKQTIKVLKEIKIEEVERLFNHLNPIAEYKHIKDLYRISVSNGNNLLSFLNDIYTNSITIQKMKAEDIFLEGNRLIANYCSFIGMFIDQNEKLLSEATCKTVE